MYAKFSTVYARNGHWHEAKRLQMPVSEFTVKVCGMQHSITRRITLALAATLFWLGQPDDAATLQQEVLDACRTHLGTAHHKTLVAKRILSGTKFQQGRLADARKLQEEAVVGSTELYSSSHEETLQSMSPLGRTHISFYDPSSVGKGRVLIRRAIDGMTKAFGPRDSRTMQVRENFVPLANISHNQEDITEAYEAIKEIYETRKEELGKVHSHTLMAMVNFAIVRIEMSDFHGAEELILATLPIGQRNYGPGHVGVLWGRYVLGRIYSGQERWSEAEQILTDVTTRQYDLLQGRGRDHGDRLRALTELAAVLNALGKVNE
ncbi:hypothetical protein GQ44DRAFT_807903 [Phaeosphaeriaceae sp. PMI808]|nr:hypothetical protein GQ44DRAFT_807903 [Phaeosphaeriaceae sp. PMI808]